jgi:hypothetical protein
VSRSFPEVTALRTVAADVLRKILQDGSVPCRLEDLVLRHFYEMGWVHSEATDIWAQNIVCVLPSKLHEKIFSRPLCMCSYGKLTDYQIRAVSSGQLMLKIAPVKSTSWSEGDESLVTMGRVLVSRAFCDPCLDHMVWFLHSCPYRWHRIHQT